MWYKDCPEYQIYSRPEIYAAVGKVEKYIKWRQKNKQQVGDERNKSGEICLKGYRAKGIKMQQKSKEKKKSKYRKDWNTPKNPSIHFIY